MNRKFGILAAIIILATSIIGGTISRASHRATPPPAGATRPVSTAETIEGDYSSAIQVISENYAGDIDYEKATQAAIQGMLSTLDPHSMFFPQAEFTKLKEDQDSRFYGIGVTILQHLDGVYVQSTVPDTPAARAGLRYGDRIVEVDGKDARDWGSEMVSKNVRGERGVPVKIKIERAGAEAPLYFTIVRDAVPLPSIRNEYMIRPGTGYIGLTGGFQHTTDDELRESIEDLKKQGMRQLVLDLRNNPGGLLDQAIDVASEFIPRGQTVLSVRGREYNQPIVYKSKGGESEDFPLVVLANRNTASASEIVAGAIQDHGRGLIVGETSFGKGLVQRIFQLPFGTGLTLTTAHYYTPYGRLIQRDYSNGSLYDYYARRDDSEDDATRKPAANNKNSNTATPTPTPTPTPRPPTGPAVKTAAGRVFYGGGGITPDIEVKPPAASPLRNRIAEAAFYFTRELAAGQLQGLENYRVDKPDPSHSPRPTDYPVTDRVVEAFRSYVQRETAKFGLEPKQMDAEPDFVKLRLRVEIVTAAFGADAGARVVLDGDPQTTRAIEALPEAKRLAESVRNGSPIG